MKPNLNCDSESLEWVWSDYSHQYLPWESGPEVSEEELTMGEERLVREPLSQPFANKHISIQNVLPVFCEYYVTLSF